LFWAKRTCDFAFVSLRYGRSREDMCMGYAMAAGGRMQYDYKQTNKQTVSRVRVYFPGYQSFDGENISRWSRIYRQKWYNFDQSGYSGVSGDKK